MGGTLLFLQLWPYFCFPKHLRSHHPYSNQEPHLNAASLTIICGLQRTATTELSKAAGASLTNVSQCLIEGNVPGALSVGWWVCFSCMIDPVQHFCLTETSDSFLYMMPGTFLNLNLRKHRPPLSSMLSQPTKETGRATFSCAR